tara:strand:+ start:89 stop:520 length:432 start_codon:yes stop_codon:yes gene_type:complete
MSLLTINEFPKGAFTDEIVITPQDFTGTTAAAETITYNVPAGSAVVGCGVKVVTPFSGASLSAVALDVGETADPDGYIDNMNIFTGGDTFAYNSGDLLDGTTSVSDFFATADTIDILVTPTDDGLADATEGEVKISFSIVRLA